LHGISDKKRFKNGKEKGAPLVKNRKLLVVCEEMKERWLFVRIGTNDVALLT
jgi:hypothetical protein